MHLVSLEVVAEIAKVFQAGIHGNRHANDWQTMTQARERCFSAALRHMAEAQYGDNRDPDSGLSHLAHAATNLVMLVWLERHPEQRGAPSEDA